MRAVRFLLGRVENIFREHFGAGIPENVGPNREIENYIKNYYKLVPGIHVTISKAKYDEQNFGMPNAKFGTFWHFPTLADRAVVPLTKVDQLCKIF